MSTNPKANAFPLVLPDGSGGWTEFHHGMSVREYMATKILAGMIANPHATETTLTEHLLTEAIKTTDALIAALNKETNA
jgi:hypothetical protein